MPTLPFEPEEIVKLKERYPQCKERVWKMSELHYDRPGMHRKYVFDFLDGTRLLISRSAFGLSRDIKEHVSASWEDWAETPMTVEQATAKISAHWKLIGGEGKLVFIGISPNRIPHWVVEQEKSDAGIPHN